MPSKHCSNDILLLFSYRSRRGRSHLYLYSSVAAVLVKWVLETRTSLGCHYKATRILIASADYVPCIAGIAQLPY